MAETQQVDESAGESPRESRDRARREARAERGAVRLAKQIGVFAKRHGGTEGHLSHVGRMGIRIVLVGEDGSWGDLIAPSGAVAQSAVTKAGITLHDSFDGEFAAKLRTGPYEWRRMAGIQLGGRTGG
jgi:hypothetical protein